MSDYQKAFSLDKKTIFVCGGAGLLGVQVSRAVAACKAKTVILDVDEDKGKKLAKELKAHFHYFDLTDLKNLSHSLKDLVKRYKKIDGWANFSYPKTKDWGRPTGETLDVDFLKTNVDWQLNSYVVASKAVCEMMKKQKQGGSIVNCGSIYGLVGNDFTIYPAAEAAAHLPYSVIKGGLVNFTRYLASHAGPYNIRVNCLCPGGVFDNQDKRFLENYSKKVPLRRLARPQEIASATVFLLSDAASYITGTSMAVDGGWTAI